MQGDLAIILTRSGWPSGGNPCGDMQGNFVIILGRFGWPKRDMKGGFAIILGKLGWPTRDMKGGISIILGRLGWLSGGDLCTGVDVQGSCSGTFHLLLNAPVL